MLSIIRQAMAGDKGNVPYHFEENGICLMMKTSAMFENCTYKSITKWLPWQEHDVLINTRQCVTQTYISVTGVSKKAALNSNKEIKND